MCHHTVFLFICLVLNPTLRTLYNILCHHYTYIGIIIPILQMRQLRHRLYKLDQILVLPCGLYMGELKFEPRVYLTKFVNFSSLKELLFYKVGVQKSSLNC